MTLLKSLLSAASTVALALPAVTFMGQAAHAQGVIKIGEINSYKAQPAFLEPYKKGMELAVEEINAKGGVNGKKIELITRDDNACGIVGQVVQDLRCLARQGSYADSGHV